MKEYIWIIACPLLFCLLDVITGYVAAMRNGTLNSSVMREGLWNKTAEIMAIIVSVFAQSGIWVYSDGFLDVTVDIPIVTAVCAYISIYELTSVVENVGKMNKYIGIKLVNLLGIDPSKVGLVYVGTDTQKEENDGR